MKNIVFILLVIVLGFSACAKKDYLVTIKTSYGDIKVILYDQTPKHKENFLKLAENGDYDSTTFHRIINQFMIQGGDVNAKDGNENKIEYTIPAEFVDSLFHHKGALAAARRGDNVNPNKESSGSQWYIVQGEVVSEQQLTTDMAKVNQYLPKLMEKPEYANLRDELTKIYYDEGQQAYADKITEYVPVIEQEFDIQCTKDYPAERLKAYTTIGGTPHLDDAYTVFGLVVEGLEVVDKIAEVQTGRMDKPLEDIYMTMEVKSMSPRKIKKLYGNSLY